MFQIHPVVWSFHDSISSQRNRNIGTRAGGEIESQPFAADDVPRQMLFRWWGFGCDTGMSIANGSEKADE